MWHVYTCILRRLTLWRWRENEFDMYPACIGQPRLAFDPRPRSEISVCSPEPEELGGPNHHGSPGLRWMFDFLVLREEGSYNKNCVHPPGYNWKADFQWEHECLKWTHDIWRYFSCLLISQPPKETAAHFPEPAVSERLRPEGEARGESLLSLSDPVHKAACFGSFMIMGYGYKTGGPNRIDYWRAISLHRCSVETPSGESAWLPKTVGWSKKEVLERHHHSWWNKHERIHEMDHRSPNLL